jgi:hypothetical protein
LYVKISNLSLSLAAAFGLTGVLLSGCASETETQAPTERQLTGSYIPQNVQQKGPITNGANDVLCATNRTCNAVAGPRPGRRCGNWGKSTEGERAEGREKRAERRREKGTRTDHQSMFAFLLLVSPLSPIPPQGLMFDFINASSVVSRK